MFKVLGFVPARKGSKGVTGKNIRKLRDIPLIEYTLKEIQKSKKINDFILSTDSEEIRGIAEKYNPIFNGLRPQSLSDDKALTLDVVKYELKQIGVDLKKFSHLMLLQPTCPLRNFRHIDNSIQKLLDLKGRSLISIVESNANHPLRMKKIYNNQLVNYIDTGYEDMRPRQDLPKVYIRNGAIYLAKISDILGLSSFSTPNCIPYEMKDTESVNIDSEIDFLIAESLLNKKLKKII